MSRFPPDSCQSEMPDNCIECGKPWSASECVHTGDSRGVGGWEDWCYCGHCKYDLFYPVLAAAPESYSHGGNKPFPTTPGVSS